MIKSFGCLFIFILLFSAARSQGDSTWMADFQKAKQQMNQLGGSDEAAYAQTGRKLEALAIANPGNAEAWYYFGMAIDKFNTASGEQIPQSTLALAQRAAQCFSNAIELSEGDYKGEVLLMDPHSKILSVWGAQAFRYLNAQNKDSAIWCLRQAALYGGINTTVCNYFKQVLDECSDSSYLFTNGDLYYYYLAYLQYVDNYHPLVRCISLNFLNTLWYPQALKKEGILELGISDDALDKIKNKKWKQQNISILNAPDIKGDSIVSWSVAPTNGEYLLRSDLIVKKFLETNEFRKPVFFAADVPQNMRLFLTEDNYACLKGLTYQIVPFKKPTKLSYLENRLSMLNEISSDDAPFTFNPDNIQVLNNYRFAYTAVANLAMEENQVSAAKNLIQFADQKYPEKLLPFFAEATKKWYEGFKEKILSTP